MLKIRRANIEDMRQYYEWRNEPAVRASAFTSEPIPWGSHIEWFTKQIQNKNSIFYIFEIEGKAIGQVRFEITDSNAEISYSIDTSFRGKKLGLPLLKQAIQQLSMNFGQVKIVTGYVKINNIASSRIFEKLGFQLQQCDTEKQANYFIKVL